MMTNDPEYGVYGDMACAAPKKRSSADIEEQAVQLMARSAVVGSDHIARQIFDVLRLGGFTIVRRTHPN